MFGVKVIEKHFTYRKGKSIIFMIMQFRLDPKEMNELVKKVRRAESIFGQYQRKRGASEKKI